MVVRQLETATALQLDQLRSMGSLATIMLIVVGVTIGLLPTIMSTVGDAVHGYIALLFAMPMAQRTFVHAAHAHGVEQHVGGLGSCNWD